jgi:ribonuclease HI
MDLLLQVTTMQGGVWLLVIIYKGEVVAATAGRAENVADAFQAELMAAVHALRLAEQSYTCYSGDGFTPPNVGVE